MKQVQLFCSGAHISAGHLPALPEIPSSPVGLWVAQEVAFFSRTKTTVVILMVGNSTFREYLQQSGIRENGNIIF